MLSNMTMMIVDLIYDKIKNYILLIGWEHK